MTEDLLTKGQAAKRLGVSVSTLERLVARSEIPQVYVGNLARFSPADLAAYINRRRRYTSVPCQSESTVIIGTFGSRSEASELSALLAREKRMRSRSKRKSARNTLTAG